MGGRGSAGGGKRVGGGGAGTATSPEDKIRDAYAAALGARQTRGDFVRLADVRDHMQGMSRAEQDAALVALSRRPDIRIVPAADRKSLTARDRNAAIRIGQDENHLIAVIPK